MLHENRSVATPSLFLGILAAVVLGAVTAAVGASAGVAIPPPYRITGYLDEAPAGASIVDEIEISPAGDPGTKRTLRIDTYGPGHEAIDEDLSHRLLSSPWQIVGEDEEIGRLFDAGRGAKVEGVFARTGPRTRLLVRELDAP